MSTIRSKDRVSLCSFTFADGRKCRSPRFKNHAHLCYFHALKESQANASVTIGRNILNRFSGSYLSACDLTNALGQVFSGVAQGSIKRKTAATLAYLGQTMVNSIQIAQANTSMPSAPITGATPSIPPSPPPNKALPTTPTTTPTRKEAMSPPPPPQSNRQPVILSGAGRLSPALHFL